MGSGGIISASAVVLAGAWLVVVMAPKLAPHVGVPQFWGGRFCEKMEPLPGTPTVTREVRSLLLSDLGNSFPLQTVFVSLFCLFCSCGKKKPTSAKRLVVESGDSVSRLCFFCWFL